jgi:putative oxygen-independent coproporphyrinogen III oxidase
MTTNPQNYSESKLPSIEHLMRPGTLSITSLPPLSLYIHLPWCIKKCPYCDFNSHGVQQIADPQKNYASSLNNTFELPEDRYIQALLKDLELSLPLIWGRSVHSIFLGGGTPSLFKPSSIERLISSVRSMLVLLPGCEITLEANPGTFEKDRFKSFRDAGVTRLSLGVQSFNDQALKLLGRVHDGAQAKEAAQEASEVFETFNLDLMYALPGQSIKELQEDLHQALSLEPAHLSIYHLSLEPNTFFAKFPPKNLPSDDLAYEMLDVITEKATSVGLHRYEVSAFAKIGHRCRHNLNYWQFGDYLGIGAGAHSKLSYAHRVLRQIRFKEPGLYMSGLESLDFIAQSNEVERRELAFEFMLNLTRLKEGFDLNLFTERTGLPLSALESGIQLGVSKGLLERDMSRVLPTAKGFDFLSDLQSYFLPG